jgi:hypothetical protein
VRLAAVMTLATGLGTDAPPAIAEGVADALVELDSDAAQRYKDAVSYEDAVGHRRWDDGDFTLDLTLALRAGARGRAAASDPGARDALCQACRALWTRGPGSPGWVLARGGRAECGRRWHRAGADGGGATHLRAE